VSEPLLSILVPSLFSRQAVAAPLLAKLSAQAEGQPVEVIVLTDNHQVPLAVKRNTLMGLAHGLYVAHLDDDDDVEATFVEDIVRAAREPVVDVICYDQLADVNGHRFFVRTGLGYPRQPANEGGLWGDVQRPPWHWCAWRRELAATSQFGNTPDEDWAWLQPLLAKATTQRRLGHVLHSYRYSSAASTFSCRQAK
jgi:hypothetical protein